MSFNPQYSLWSRDTLSSSEGALYDNSGEFEIVGGVSKLIPLNFASGIYAFNAPWDHLTGWNIENTLDSYSILEEDLILYTGLSSENGNIGSLYNTAFYTSGSSSTIIYDFQTSALPDQLTIELDVRSLTSLNYSGEFLETGSAYHGIVLNDGSKQSFIEVHPEGLKVYGISGAILPGNYTDGLRKVRIVKKTNDIVLMSYYDENVVYVNDAMQDWTSNGAIPFGQNSYVAFGSLPWTGGADFSGSPGGVDYTGSFYDYDETVTARPEFQGKTLWDDIKINTETGLSSHPESFFAPYPAGNKVLHTDAWYPPSNIVRYQNAFIEIIGTNGGVTSVKAEQLVPSNDSLTGVWQQVPTVDAPLVIARDEPSGTYVYDLSKAEVFPPPFQNGVRFKVTSVSTAGQAPMIDTITVSAVGGLHEGIVKPNWKLSAFPKDLYFSSNEDTYEDYIPPANPEDICYFHNEAGAPSLTGLFSSSILPVGVSGQVIPSVLGLASPSSGLVKVSDGFYGDAWRNFTEVGQYSGNWFSEHTKYLDETDVHKGEVLDIYYPYGNSSVITSGAASVFCSVYEYRDFDNSLAKAQNVTVKGYNENSIISGPTDEVYGLFLSGISIPTSSSLQIGAVEGVIQIPKGPGVVVTLHEGASSSSITLCGENYRTPAKFACARLYTGDHSSSVEDTYISIGVIPRQNGPLSSYRKYGDWAAKLQENEYDEFRIFSITGSIVDHSWVSYSGFDGSVRKVNFGLDDSIDIIANGTGTSSEPGDYGNIFDVNDYLTGAGAADIYYSPDRNSILLEGWVRPYGILTSTESTQEILFEATDASSNGLKLYLNNNGRLLYQVSIGYSACVSGELGTGIIGTSTATSNSKGEVLNWGEWNHIGFCMETASFGDAEHRQAYPACPTHYESSDLLHGARIARTYLTINNKIVAQNDIAGDPYMRPLIAANSVDATASYPPFDMAGDTLPKLPRFYSTGELNVKIGENFLGDFDHLRVSLRDRSDALTDLFTYGSKSSPGMFLDKRAPKPFIPTSGGTSHWEMAHIFPMESNVENYEIFDWGFSPVHGFFRGGDYVRQIGALNSELNYYSPSDFFFKEKDTGPHGRDALRLGPGTCVEVPFNSFDERIFNGSGSFSYDQEEFITSDPDFQTYVENKSGNYNATTSSSHIRMGGWVKLNNLPTGNTISSVFTFDQDNSLDDFGKHQIYLGVSSSGYTVIGKRYNGTDDLGPWTGTAQLSTGTWYHLGLDANLELNYAGGFISSADPFFYSYVNGELDRQVDNLNIISGGSGAINAGRPIGYEGWLGAASNRSCFRFGGYVLRDSAKSFEYGYEDISLQDVVIGYGLKLPSGETSQWDWGALSSLQNLSGHTEVFTVNGQTIDYIEGTMTQGIGTYPATPISDAGTQTLLFTMNGGNDYEGLFQRGLGLSSPSLFVNAESYYAIYENNTNTDIIGSTDSPIQIGTSVSNEGVNLAMVNISPWQVKGSISTFDMSDSNYANITAKINGDLFVRMTSGDNCLTATNSLSSNGIRVSSLPVYDKNSPITDSAYFVYLIGNGKKGVYYPNAESHTDAAASVSIWKQNLQKIKESISVTDSNGEIIPFEVFPYGLTASPYPAAAFDSISSDFFGENSVDSDLSLQNGTYSIFLVASKQTIGDSVFINYPSIDFATQNINLNDSEIYKPIPLMREDLFIDPLDASNPTSGNYSVVIGESDSKYDLRVWNASTVGLTGNTESYL